MELLSVQRTYAPSHPPRAGEEQRMNEQINFMKNMALALV
jgi:hypothetical protein